MGMLLWYAAVNGVAKSQTRLSNWTTATIRKNESKESVDSIPRSFAIEVSRELGSVVSWRGIKGKGKFLKITALTVLFVCWREGLERKTVDDEAVSLSRQKKIALGA